MMSHAKVLAVLIAIVVLGVGSVALHAEFAGFTPVVTRKQVVVLAPNAGSSARQERAERKSEQQGMDAACAALQKMGTTDKVCPPK